MESGSNSEGVNPSPVKNESHWNPFKLFFEDCRSTLKPDKLGKEIAKIAFPAALALTADPVASIIDTAFIGRIGPVELAAVGVSIAIINQVSKVFNFPLVSVTTSLVAEEDATTEMVAQGSTDIEEPVKECRTNPINNEKDIEDAVKECPTNPIKNEKDTEDAVKECPTNPIKNEKVIEGATAELAVEGLEIAKSIKEGSANPTSNENDGQISCPPITSEAANTALDSTTTAVCIEKKLLPSVSSALVIGAVLGIIQALMMVVAAKLILSIMGVHAKSPMRPPAERYLKLRALGAPAVVISLATQGVFRGFKDTMTPLYATLAGDICNIALDPVLIFVLKLGVSGAAIAHVVSQYLIALILLLSLHRQVVLLPRKISDLRFARFFKSGGLLLARVIAATVCTTLAASMAARQGTISMAAFQICLQIWMATSLLADALALAGQAILASAFAVGDYEKARSAAARTLQMAMVLGIFLGVVLAGGMHVIARVFSNDIRVLKMTYIGMPFVAATQPLNSLAFVFDGINFGASDFAFAAYSMVFVSMITIGCLFTLSPHWGFVGVWIALTIMMTLRMFAGVWRIGTGSGPWRFLRTRKGSPL